MSQKGTGRPTTGRMFPESSRRSMMVDSKISPCSYLVLPLADHVVDGVHLPFVGLVVHHLATQR